MVSSFLFKRFKNEECKTDNAVCLFQSQMDTVCPEKRNVCDKLQGQKQRRVPRSEFIFQVFFIFKNSDSLYVRGSTSLFFVFSWFFGFVVLGIFAAVEDKFGQLRSFIEVSSLSQ